MSGDRPEDLALRESEERYRVMVEHSPEAIVILDMDSGRFVDCNRKAAALFDTDPDTLMRYGPADLSPPLQPNGRPSDEMSEELVKSSLAGELPSFEWTHRTLRGRDVACEVRLVRLPHAGRFLVRGSITDVSRRKAAEEERRRLEAQLYRAQKNESLTQFAAGIVHDFNNLLAAVLGNADLALMNLPAGHPSRRQIERLQRATVRGSDLTRQLMEYLGKGTEDTGPVDLVELVKGTADVLEIKVAESGRLELELDDEACWVDGDSAQLGQVVMNLVTNAAESLDGDGGRVRVEVRSVLIDHPAPRREGPSGRFVLVVVRDNGSGMDANTRRRIFEPFYSTKGEGRGIGLAWVEGIVKGHRGTITVSSRVGEGTSFQVLLPLCEPPPQVLEEPTQQDRRWAGAGRVLLVDRDASVRESTSGLLQALGFTVESCADRAEAIAALQSRDLGPRLALVDISTQRAEGLATRDAIQGIAPGLPVVLMSGFHTLEPSLDGRVVLVKPFGVDDLRAAVSRILQPNQPRL